MCVRNISHLKIVLQKNENLGIVRKYGNCKLWNLFYVDTFITKLSRLNEILNWEQAILQFWHLDLNAVEASMIHIFVISTQFENQEVKIVRIFHMHLLVYIIANSQKFRRLCHQWHTCTSYMYNNFLSKPITSRKSTQMQRILKKKVPFNVR